MRRMGFSFPAIGRTLGRDHSSVMAMIRKATP
jgi:chromosomal replication initiation ATPase DnaA